MLYAFIIIMPVVGIEHLEIQHWKWFKNKMRITNNYGIIIINSLNIDHWVRTQNND